MSEPIDEKFVRKATSLLGIELTDNQVPKVIANLRRIVEIASQVNEFPLDQMMEEAGPVWRL
jgi:Asp-tRNA(Asn)/Glu-tRNA(Gln) amidotransferase C subunit